MRDETRSSFRRPCVAAVLLLGFALVVTFGTTSPQAAAPTPVDGDYIVPDFAFEDGSRVANLRLAYTTLGAPARDAKGEITNAVLLLHQTGATARQFLTDDYRRSLFAAGQPLDASRFYLIMPDGIGAGGSAKPSDGLKARFPKYGYRDQVEAQRLLLEQGLGVTHLAMVLGTSMGGMQAWLWASRHPGMMDATVAIAATPAAVTGRNKVWRDVVTAAIRDDPDFHGGEYATQPTRWRAVLPLVAIMTGNARTMQGTAPTAKAAAALREEIVASGETYDANDFLAVFESSWDYDPAPNLAAISAPLLAIDFGDDMLNPAELGLVPAGMTHVRNGTYVLIPSGPDTFGHLTLEHPLAWRDALASFMKRNVSEAHGR